MRDLILKFKCYVVYMYEFHIETINQLFMSDLDQFMCCDGRDCACYGMTIRDNLKHSLKRKIKNENT